MKKITDFFSNRVVISALGLIALSLLVWFAGPSIKFGEENYTPLASDVSRLLTIMVLLILWGLNNLRIQIMSKKQNNDLLEDLQQNQQDSGPDLATHKSSEEMQVVSQRFSDAMATIKKLKFKGKNRSRALYELPWYIIIGPPGSGKTTALVNSSLDFPLAEQFGQGALQGVGGTRYCDWWFTNDAVLIDTAGRYTTQDSHKVIDSNAWEGFLKLLKKNRPRRPVNGAIVAISIYDLLLQTDEERMQHAKTIRLRIDELMEKLEIRFPIYLMFTKADLVSGFSEYFEDLGKEEREQVWGVSLPDAAGASDSPDFEFLDQEYQKLLERLYAREVSRIHYERDVKRRAAIQGFPQQFENLKSVIDNFVKQTFVKNRFQYQPYLRGIYFTSGTQDGSPIDRLMTAVSANFGFSANAENTLPGQGKSYFLGNLFRQIIFPEAELVGSNRKYEIAIKWLQRSVYSIIVLASIGLLTIWSGSLNRHSAAMSEVEDYIADFNAENKRLNRWNKDLRVVLPTLNALAKASIVYDQDEHPWLSGFGLYDAQVDQSANLAYDAQLKELLLPRIVYYLEKQIQKGHGGGDLYHSFRTYMMFNKTDKIEKQVIIDWFVEHWKNNMEGEASSRIQLEQHLKALLDLGFKPVALNDQIVKQTRSLLLRVPVHQRIYSRIRTNPQYNQKINLFNLFGESVRDVFVQTPAIENTLAIPYMFTKEGYDSIDLSTGSPVISEIVSERWVLTDDEKSKVDFVKDNLEQISRQVKDLYMAEYSDRWQKVFAALKLKSLGNINQVGEVLASFTDPVYSPLLSVLQVAASNTQLSSQLLQNMKDDSAEGKGAKVTSLLADKFKGTKVDQQFRNINVLLRESNKKAAPVNTIMQKIQLMQDFLSEIMVAPDPHKKAFEVVKKRYSSGSGNAITALRTYAKKQPGPVKKWLNSLTDETWKSLLAAAKQYINAEWQNRVYNSYRQALKGRYPLNRSSTDELALFDFSEFFKPEGTMDMFYSEFIKPFISTRGGWKNRAIDNFSLGLSRKTLAQIKRAQSIKSIFFRKNPESPSISFQLKPHQLDKLDASFRLELGEQRINYKHGPKFWKELHWTVEDERVRIVFDDLEDKRHEKSFDGPWAWFKLQDQSSLKKTSKSNVYMATYEVIEKIQGGATYSHNIKFLIKAKSVNNPFSRNLLSSFKCPQSL